MFQLITLVPALYVGCRFIYCLPLPVLLKIILFLCVLTVSQFHRISRLIYGTMFSPELPRLVMIIQGWLFGAMVFFTLGLLLRDVVNVLGYLSINKGFDVITSGVVLMLIALVLSGTGVWQAIKIPAVHNVNLTLKNLPPAFDGYRFVQLTDLHACRLLTGRWMNEVVSITNGLKPDLILVTGDMADGTVDQREKDVAPLGQLTATDGVWAIPGNHEYYFDAPAWIEAYSQLGLQFLLNEHTKIKREGSDLVIAGITDEAASRFNLATPDLNKALQGVSPDETVILMSHRPDNAHQSAAAGVAVQLSGHTHGGMVRGLDMIVARANKGFVSRLYHVNNMALYVSNGTGLWNGFPLRLGHPSEITLFTLRRGD